MACALLMARSTPKGSDTTLAAKDVDGNANCSFDSSAGIYPLCPIPLPNPGVPVKPPVVRVFNSRFLAGVSFLLVYALARAVLAAILMVSEQPLLWRQAFAKLKLE